MIEETRENEIQFISISPADLLSEPECKPDFYISVLDHNEGKPIDMPAIYAAIQAAGLYACDDTTRYGADFEARTNVVNIVQDDMEKIVSVINGLGYRTDEDEYDDNDDDESDDDGNDYDGGW